MHPCRILQTDRLSLCPLNLSYANAAFDILGCHETTRGRSFAKSTHGEAEAWLRNRILDWEKDNFGWWAIETKDRQVVGFCGFFRRNHELELGYVIKAAHQKNGYGQEAVTAALVFAKQSGFGVYATIRPSNLSSKLLAERCGMKRMPKRLDAAPDLDLYRTK